jgi:hypothetical protein
MLDELVSACAGLASAPSGQLLDPLTSSAARKQWCAGEKRSDDAQRWRRERWRPTVESRAVALDGEDPCSRTQAEVGDERSGARTPGFDSSGQESDLHSWVSIRHRCDLTAANIDSASSGGLKEELSRRGLPARLELAGPER